MIERIEEHLQSVCPDPPRRALLARYGALLLERNAKINLTGARDAEAVAEHIADSLSLLQLVDAGPLVDVGSGGGLPAIPLAVVRNVAVTLVESVGKKACFLVEALSMLGLDGEVVARRAEDAAHDARYRERFASATARGLGPLTTVLELTLPFVAVGGRAVLQRAPLTDAERNDAVGVGALLGGVMLDQVYVSPSRCVVLFEKREPTPQGFPRRVGMPAKRPLRATHGRPAA